MAMMAHFGVGRFLTHGHFSWSPFGGELRLPPCRRVDVPDPAEQVESSYRSPVFTCDRRSCSGSLALGPLGFSGNVVRGSDDV